MTEVDDSTVDTHGQVELTIPADPAMVSVLRTVTAALAARRDFTLEEIDDLRIAVDEACALLLPHAAGTARLHAAFGGPPEALIVEVRVAPTLSSVGIDHGGFAWLVLSALTDDVTSDFLDNQLSVTLTKSRAPRG